MIVSVSVSVTRNSTHSTHEKQVSVFMCVCVCVYTRESKGTCGNVTHLIRCVNVNVSVNLSLCRYDPRKHALSHTKIWWVYLRVCI